MMKPKVTALLALSLVTALFASGAAQAEATIETTMAAGGVLIDGTGAAAGSANVVLTAPDGGDEDELRDPVVGVLVRYFVGEREIECGPSAITDPSGVARCGLLLDSAEIAALGGYTAVFEGDATYMPATDTGSLIVSQGQELP